MTDWLQIRHRVINIFSWTRAKLETSHRRITSHSGGWWENLVKFQFRREMSVSNDLKSSATDSPSIFCVRSDSFLGALSAFIIIFLLSFCCISSDFFFCLFPVSLCFSAFLRTAFKRVQRRRLLVVSISTRTLHKEDGWKPENRRCAESFVECLALMSSTVLNCHLEAEVKRPSAGKWYQSCRLRPGSEVRVQRSGFSGQGSEVRVQRSGFAFYFSNSSMLCSVRRLRLPAASKHWSALS